MGELQVDEDGLVGVLVTPDDRPPGRPVLVLGGSDGGTPLVFARVLAAQGFTCLGLAYFREPGLPRTLVEVPLEYVHRALAWFRDRPEVDGARVAVFGMSRGSELALLTGTRAPDAVSGVAVLTPASVAFAGLAGGFLPSRRSAWSEGGEPVPFVPFPRTALAGVSRRGWRIGSIYERALRNEAAVARATIPVERIGGDVLLVSGDEDGMWPASRMCEMVMARMAEHGRAAAVVHLRYPHAGHLLSREGREQVDRSRLLRILDFGGTPEGDAEAGDDAGPRIVDFLERAAR